MGYLNETGLNTLWAKIKSVIADAKDEAILTAATDATSKANEAAKTATNHMVVSQGALHITDDTDNVGTANENSVVIDSDSVDIIKGGQTVAEYSQGLTVWSDNGTEIAHLGYGTTQGESGETTSPYYDLGVRKSGTDKGSWSVIEGYETTAIGYHSHAEGYNTTARGHISHTEGSGTSAAGVGSHAEGIETIATADGQHVQGGYNVANGSHADIVGNGASKNNRSNAYALDWDGNGYFAGDVYVGCNADSTGGKKLVVVETGTSNGWKYQKFENGDMFAWMTAVNSGSVSFTSATGGGYTTLGSRNLPSGFISAPSVFATASTTTSAWLTLTPYDVTTTSFTPRLARHFSNNALSAGTLIMNYYAVGTWK